MLKVSLNVNLTFKGQPGQPCMNTDNFVQVFLA